MSRSRFFGFLRENYSPKVHCMTQLIHMSFYNYIHCITKLKHIACTTEKVPQPRYAMQQASKIMNRCELHVHTSPAPAHLQEAQVNYSICYILPSDTPKQRSGADWVRNNGEDAAPADGLGILSSVASVVSPLGASVAPVAAPACPTAASPSRNGF
jgi:hypothetical protein